MSPSEQPNERAIHHQTRVEAEDTLARTGLSPFTLRLSSDLKQLKKAPAQRFAVSKCAHDMTLFMLGQASEELETIGLEELVFAITRHLLKLGLNIAEEDLRGGAEAGVRSGLGSERAKGFLRFTEAALRRIYPTQEELLCEKVRKLSERGYAAQA